MKGNGLSLLLLMLFTAVGFSQGTQLLRQPTISNTHVVFVYANDLWKAPINGGDAIRLTSDKGAEYEPHFSNDGAFIAFTGQYGGNSDIYVIPSQGGEPKRLTFHPDTDVVQGWTNDNKILFRSNRAYQPTKSNTFYTIGLDDGFPSSLGLPRAAYGEMSSDGKQIAYTPITSWDPEWRNYRGGQAMPIWIVNLETKDLITTPQPTKERHLTPIWLNNVVYYISERDYTSNIWSFNPQTKEEAQITFHKKFDVKSLDANQSQIVYEQGGYLHLLNLETKKSKRLTINVAADLNFARPKWETIAGSDLIHPNISPNGKRAIFEHRGEVFTIPKENGTWRNITKSSGIADRDPVWSPKGDKIAWFSDESGNYKLVIADQNGQNKIPITLPNSTFYFKPQWSPDGKHIAYSDTNYNVWITNVLTKQSTKVDSDNYAHPNRTMNPVWSPDSKWIAYSKQENSHFKSIYVYNITAKETIQITDGIADAISPVWDASGKYIYTLASTNYGLSSGWLDMSSYDPKTLRNLYAIVLNSKDKAPNLPQTDEEIKDETPNKKETKSKKKKEKKPETDKKEEDIKPTIVDKANIFDRLVPLKLPKGNYTALEKAKADFVYIFENLEGENGTKIHQYDIKKSEPKEFATGVSEFVVSQDRKNILLNQSGVWKITASETPITPETKAINTALKIKINPKEEYHQIFKEGWRFMRDFLYVNNTHGAPWDDIYKWYSPWIKHVRHRTDLNYVVDIMSGEIAIGHSYVSGGDLPDLNRVPVGLLGCDFKLENNNYRISKIYTGERWNPEAYAPLNLQGIKEGDYILSINKTPLNASKNIYELLEQTADREITISVNSSTSLTNAKSVLVKPVSNDYNLRYVNWVEENRKKVDQLSNGKLAYVYVPNTSGNGFASFNRYYFSQQDKKGVVIDERNNGGGSAADYMIDIMSRELFGYFNSKSHNNRPWTTPIAGIWGPKVMIINERAGSGGDLLPYMFKAKKLGPLVGTRTWGGLVGTWDTPRFIDGGRMVAPRGGFYDTNGNWAVEGKGIAPDIEVIQHPKYSTNRKDPQLERAVEEALKLLKTEEFQLKPEPKAPIRWKRPNGYEKEN